MNRYERRLQVLAITLAVLAGYVDAIGLIASGGFFVSFMSGNSTRMAVGLVDPAINAAIAGSLIAAFIFGVALGGVVGHKARGLRHPAILAAMFILLSAAAVAQMALHHLVCIILLAIGMGAANAMFEQNGDAGIGVTYMTGSVVRLGHALAGLILGQPRKGWLPYLILWLGFLVGAVLGGLCWVMLAGTAIWIAAAYVGMLAIVTYRRFFNA